MTLTDARLFVPREWTNDAERCRRAGIPEEIWKTPRTKFDLALEIVIQAVEEGVRFKWVSADGGYGENAFLLPLDNAGLRFMVDVPRVWVDAGRKEPPRQWHLLVRREIDTPRKIKYTLSNAPAEMSLERLSYIQGQRYWVERALQDAKSHTGLGDYQVRGWLGWHHHMAIVLMAMLFMLEERMRHGVTAPMLSTADIEKVLKHYLPRRDANDSSYSSCESSWTTTRSLRRQRSTKLNSGGGSSGVSPRRTAS